MVFCNIPFCLFVVVLVSVLYFSLSLNIPLPWIVKCICLCCVVRSMTPCNQRINSEGLWGWWWRGGMSAGDDVYEQSQSVKYEYCSWGTFCTTCNMNNGITQVQHCMLSGYLHILNGLRCRLPSVVWLDGWMAVGLTKRIYVVILNWRHLSWCSV